MARQNLHRESEMTQDRYYALYHNPVDGKIWVSYSSSFVTTAVVIGAHKIVRYDHRKNIYYYYKNRDGEIRHLTDEEIILVLLSVRERNEYV